MADWKVAGSLDELLSQLNALAPGRSKASDGSIGDAAHATRDSDHNPWVVIAGQAYVTARDFTHDPAGGLDCGRLADHLQHGHDQRVKYVIWNRRIMAGTGGPQPWTWRPYSGANPHTRHLHLSVVADARALVRIPWQLATPPKDDDMTDEQDKMLRAVYAQLTTRLPNRRGEQGTEIINGGADTLLGYAANADGSTFRAAWTLHAIEERLDELADLVRAGGVQHPDPAAFAAEVAADLARRLAG
jgi:hypothetical protein